MSTVSLTKAKANETYWESLQDRRASSLKCDHESCHGFGYVGWSGLKQFRGRAYKGLPKLNKRGNQFVRRIEDGVGVSLAKGRRRVLMESSPLVQSPLFCKLLPPTSFASVSSWVRRGPNWVRASTTYTWEGMRIGSMDLSVNLSWLTWACAALVLVVKPFASVASCTTMALIPDVMAEASWVLAGKATTEKTRGTRTMRLVKKCIAKEEWTVTCLDVAEGLRGNKCRWVLI